MKEERNTEVNKDESRENKMGTMPVNELLISMSLPMMISMLVQALYNVVDSIFVSRISENALTAVSLAFPIQSLMIALGAGTGVGVNALLSRSLGEKDYKRVNASAENGIFLAGINFLVFLIIGLFAVRPFYCSQTNDAEIITYGIQYLTIACCFSFGLYTQFIFERLLQSTGKTFYTMITQATGAVINIILDPIFIFGLCGAPRLGVAGAAIATVIGQIVAGILAMIINHKVNDEIHLSVKEFRPSVRVIGQIYTVGIPSIIMQSIGSIMVYGMNRILIAFSSTATAVFGVYFKLQSFVFMPVFGLNNGMVPIIAYNYGARQKERMIKTMKLSILYALAIMTVGLVIFQVFPDKLFMLFDASEHMLSMGIPALRIISFHFLLAAFGIVCTSVFQALGNGVYSMIVSICRQLVVLLPAAYILAQFGDVNYVWWAFPIAEAVSVILTIVFMIMINKKTISRI
ncbi:MAG: MATE family efflux transporter [Lachnospiraceae bacterium]|nr:MATE family efflux transporter [Lachnospiraceae bacterium]